MGIFFFLFHHLSIFRSVRGPPGVGWVVVTDTGSGSRGYFHWVRSGMDRVAKEFKFFFITDSRNTSHDPCSSVGIF